MTPSFPSDPTLPRTQMTVLRIARVVAPIVVLLATVILGMRFGAFESSYSSTTLTGTLNLGLLLFPAGTFFILQALARWTRRRESELWPALTAHVMETKYRLTYLRGGPFVDFWYVFNGRRHEGYSIQYRHVPRSESPYRAGMSVEVRVDPENPDVAVLSGGDDAARFYITAGVVSFAAAPVAGWLLVWLGN